MSAAQSLFLENGFGATTIEQITAAADVAKGTFYLHFASKDELRAALGEKFARQHLARVVAAVARISEEDWRGKLAAWARASVAFYVESIRFHDVLFHDARSPTREGLVDNIVIDDLAMLLNEGESAGAWTVHGSRRTAVFLFTGLHGVVDDAFVGGEKVGRKRLARIAERLCVATVVSPLR
jgi:AcrR family transcriptional regulator